jgi:DNA-binding LacI/PurR family transcriptional regulator
LRVIKVEPGKVPSVLKVLRGRREELGFVLWPGEWPGRPEGSADILAILAALAASKRPVAILDEMGGFPIPEGRRRAADLRVFTIAASLAGRDMGKALLRLGHRRIAYFSPYQGLRWSDARHQGLAAAFSAAGRPGAVIPFGLAFGRKYNRVLQTGRFHAGAAGRTAAIFDRILGQRVGKGAREGALAARMREDVFPGLYAGLEFELLDRWFEEEIQAAMLPAFRQALADKGITAWVGANDATALAAARFLRGEGRRIPGDVSVAGFDNTPASFEAGLTSYHFGITGFSQALLGFLLHPARKGGSRNDRTEEVEGVLISRGSTGPAA